jgi:hypothetical protein
VTAMLLDLAKVDRTTFAPHLDTVFLLQRPSAPLALTLREVADLPSAPTAPRRAFLLRFVSDEPGVLPQQIYALSHPVLGAMEIFLVAAGPQGGGMRYDAVFG